MRLKHVQHLLDSDGQTAVAIPAHKIRFVETHSMIPITNQSVTILEEYEDGIRIVQ